MRYYLPGAKVMERSDVVRSHLATENSLYWCWTWRWTRTRRIFGAMCKPHGQRVGNLALLLRLVSDIAYAPDGLDAQQAQAPGWSDFLLVVPVC